jgi:hypothetical protein
MSAEDDLGVLKQRRLEDESLRNAGRDVILLAEALQNLKLRNPTGLRRLALSIVIYRRDAITRHLPSQVLCWIWVHEAATRTFSLAMAALSRSKMPVQSLDIFSGKPSSLGLGLSRDTLSRIHWTNPTAYNFAALTELSICVTEPVMVETNFQLKFGGDAPWSSADLSSEPKLPLVPLKELLTDEVHFASLVKMLTACPNLAVLEIAGYRITHLDLELAQLRDTTMCWYVHCLSLMPPLKHLRRLRLAGLEVLEQDLKNLLQNHCSTLREIELQQIFFVNGLSALSFDFPASGAFCLDTVLLKDLWVGSSPVKFCAGLGDNCTKLSGDFLKHTEIFRLGQDARKAISFYQCRGSRLAVQLFGEWNYRNQQEFGTHAR